MKSQSNSMISTAIAILFLADVVPAMAGSILTPGIRGNQASGTLDQAVNCASFDGGVAFLVVLGLGYGVKRFIDPMLKHKNKDKTSETMTNNHF
jgi:hypothetical protein